MLDAGLVAHLGVITGGWPMVVPTMYGFTADTLYLHGSVASQSLNTAGTPVCVTVTLTDGLVLARSVFEHTINYRSAMIYGQPRLVTDPAERLAGLRAIAEHVAPGQWDYARQPSRKELAAVRLLALSLEEASVKIRTGPPSDGDSPGCRAGPVGRANCRWPPPGSNPSPIRPSRPASPSLPTSAPAPVPRRTEVPAASQDRERTNGVNVNTGPSTLRSGQR